VATYAEGLTKIGLVVAEKWTTIVKLKPSCSAISIYYRMFSTETTGPILTKILHDIVALVALFNHAYTRRYPIWFLNARAISARG